MSHLLELPSWAAFRDLCFTLKNLNNQFTEDANCYDLYGPDANSMTWHLRFNKSDATEFESTYKALCNFAIGQRAHAFASGDFDFAGDVAEGTCQPGGSVEIDYVFAEALYITGGSLILSGSVAGDWIEVHVVHPVYGIIKTYLKKRFVPAAPGGHATPIMELKTPYAGNIPAGLKLRTIYHSTGPDSVKIGLNLDLHRAI